MRGALLGRVAGGWAGCSSGTVSVTEQQDDGGTVLGTLSSFTSGRAKEFTEPPQVWTVFPLNTVQYNR